jgi:hypothetical protein
MELLEVIAWFVGVSVSLLMLIGFFSMWHLLARIKHNIWVLGLQLDQLLKAYGVKDPVGDRQAEITAAERKWENVARRREGA